MVNNLKVFVMQKIQNSQKILSLMSWKFITSQRNNDVIHDTDQISYLIIARHLPACVASHLILLSLNYFALSWLKIGCTFSTKGSKKGSNLLQITQIAILNDLSNWLFETLG